jgi:AcrR family transcriptional regulator
VPSASSRPGRPRTGGGPAGHDVRREILDAAQTLFAADGYEQVSMSRLAREVGLTQSSLYYYFRRKDEILAVLISDSQLVPSDLLGEIVAAGGSPAAQLHRFVRGDVVNLWTHPLDLSGISRAASRDPDAFASYFADVARLERQLADVIRSGIEQGQLRPVDPELTAVTILTNDEGVQGRQHTPLRWPITEVAAHLAEMVVAGLLADPSTLATVIAEARSLDQV